MTDSLDTAKTPNDLLRERDALLQRLDELRAAGQTEWERHQETTRILDKSDAENARLRSTIAKQRLVMAVAADELDDYEDGDERSEVAAALRAALDQAPAGGSE